MPLTRREAMKSGLVAAAAALTPRTKGNPMPALSHCDEAPIVRPIREPAAPPIRPVDPQAELRAINPRNDALVERCYVLVHFTRQACEALAEAHKDECTCEYGEDCYTASGALWFLEALESAFEGGLVPFWTGPFTGNDGEPHTTKEAAERLQLSGSAMIQWLLDDYHRGFANG